MVEKNPSNPEWEPNRESPNDPNRPQEIPNQRPDEVSEPRDPEEPEGPGESPRREEP